MNCSEGLSGRLSNYCLVVVLLGVECLTELSSSFTLIYTESFVLLLYYNCITFDVVLLKALPNKRPVWSTKDVAAELGTDRTLSLIPNAKEKMATELKVNKCARLQQPKLWERSLKGWQLHFTERHSKPSVKGLQKNW